MDDARKQWLDDWEKRDHQRNAEEGRLTGADVRWLASKSSGHPDLQNANLRGARLAKASLSQLNLQGANLTDSDLTECDLRGAELSDALLQGATLRGADLRDSDLERARLEGADLSMALLSGATLIDARLNAETRMKDARLFTGFGGAPARGPRLVGIRWNDAPVSEAADWEQLDRLGDETLPPGASTKLAPLIDPPTISFPAADTRLANAIAAEVKREALMTAVRSYVQVAGILRRQGLLEVSRRCELRARRLERRVLEKSPLAQMESESRSPSWWDLVRQSASWLVDVLSGYGLSPVRLIVTYLSTVSGFAVFYGLLGMSSWGDAIWFSVIAFHGRGIVNGTLTATSPLLAIPAIEAVIGLFVEALLVASIIRFMFKE